VSVSVQTVGGEECAWGELILGEVQGKGVGREEMAVPVEEVIARTKKLNLFYSAVTNEGEQPKVWYLTEPFGLGLVHSRTPNFACHPFANALTGRVVSLLWPLREVGNGEVCSRDYALST
ncbi:Tubulin--tyrosine ligase-like protein 12, partial [Geodia barretti]